MVYIPSASHLTGIGGYREGLMET